MRALVATATGRLIPPHLRCFDENRGGAFASKVKAAKATLASGTMTAPWSLGKPGVFPRHCIPMCGRSAIGDTGMPHTI